MDALAGPPEQAQLERAKRVQAKAAAPARRLAGGVSGPRPVRGRAGPVPAVPAGKPGGRAGRGQYRVRADVQGHTRRRRRRVPALRVYHARPPARGHRGPDPEVGPAANAAGRVATVCAAPRRPPGRGAPVRRGHGFRVCQGPVDGVHAHQPLPVPALGSVAVCGAPGPRGARRGDDALSVRARGDGQRDATPGEGAGEDGGGITRPSTRRPPRRCFGWPPTATGSSSSRWTWASP